MNHLIGRKAEQKQIDQILNSKKAEFVAIYGRRRIGKTFLVTEISDKFSNIFQATGLKNGKKRQQLELFSMALSRTFFEGAPLAVPNSWMAAFELLTTQVIKRSKKGEPFIVFLDELPWFASPKAGFLEMLDHYWNTQWSKLPYFKLITCGSAASWMIKNLIHSKGGLHNRVTLPIHLKPFKLAETEEFLLSQGVQLDRKQILDLYLCLGGVPFYLCHVQKGLSARQNISRICFQSSGPLQGEYPKLLESLFDDSAIHDRILRALANRAEGLSKDEIFSHIKVTSGGRVQEKLEELVRSGFIEMRTPFGSRKKLTYYRIIDEYIWFYMKWISPLKGSLSSDEPDYWEKKTQTPGYSSWAGYAFESVCLKHHENIARALGLRGISYDVGGWRYVPPTGKKAPIRKLAGAQIDLLFDRADGVISLCELKYSSHLFTIERDYAEVLKHKMAVFSERTHTKKQLFLVLMTPFGIKKNAWSEGLIQNEVTAEALFE